VVGVFAACCAGGATLALITSAAFDGKGTFGSAPPGLNTPVEDGKFRFTVTSVSCGHDTVGTIVTRQAQGQYCIVDLSVTNIGTKGQLLLDSVQKAVGSDGAVYGPDLHRRRHRQQRNLDLGQRSSTPGTRSPERSSSTSRTGPS
jgi:hypothetical protein